MVEIKIKVDSLGRVVILIGIRKRLGIELNSEINMSLDDDCIIITSIKNKCAICKN